MKDTRKTAIRERLLSEWANIIYRNATGGALTGGAVRIQRMFSIAGPRAGALELLCAGLDAGKLLQAFSRNDCAVVRQLCPWDFTGDPQAFMAGRYVRIETGWPADLAQTSIRLADLCTKPKLEGRWVAGVSETGHTVVPQLSDRTSNFLLSGATGAGKSVAVRNLAIQLAQDPANALVLCDGKMGESLRAVEHLPGVVAPVAVEVDEMRAALGWACTEMRERYARGVDGDGRLVVIFDEFQEAVADPAIVAMLRKLTAQGRAAHVHCILATQHPTVDAFGDSATRRNLTGKLALRVEDPDASRVAIGGATPRADQLLGCGDSYIVGGGAFHRLQGTYTDDKDVARVIEQANGRAAWRWECWPEYEPEAAIGQDLPGSGRATEWNGSELAAALVSAFEGEGRPAMCKRAAGLGTSVGDTRGRRLLELGRELCEVLQTSGYTLALSG